MNCILSAIVKLIVLGALLSGCAVQRELRAGRKALHRGDAITARWHLSAALRLAPQLIEKRGFQNDYHLARRDAALTEGHQALDKGRWLLAVGRFNKSLVVAPNYQPAQAGLAKANAAAAHMYYLEALADADRDNLERARSRLEKVLYYCPTHPDGLGAAASLDQPESTAPQAYHDALAELALQHWDEAIGAFTKAKAAAPNHLPSRARLVRTHGDAARVLTGSGRDHLDDGRLREAENDFGRALGYKTNYGPAVTGLADCDLARARQAASASHFGVSLLWAYEAREHLNNKLVRNAISQAKGQIARRSGVTLKFVPITSQQPLLAVTVASLNELLPSRLARSGGQWVRLNNQDDANFTATAQLLDMQIQTKHVNSEQRNHPFTATRQVPNPAISRLRHLIQSAEHELDVLEHECTRLCDQVRRLQHQVECGQTRFVNALRRARRRLRRIERDRNEARSQLHSLRHQLACEPDMVTQSYQDYWPYTRHTYKQTGLLSLQVQVQGQQHVITRRFKETDHTIDNANPRVGLASDSLRLTDPARVEKKLVSDAADQSVQWIIRWILRNRSAQLQAISKAHAQADRPVQGLEAQIDSLVLLEIAGVKKATKQLAKLRRDLEP